MKTYLHDPMDFSKTLKLLLRMRHLDPSQRRKGHTARDREEEVYAQMYPRGRSMNSTTHNFEPCKLYKQERKVLGEGILKNR
ncbi:unnamed protein product [Scytosiphon promiscuus]